ncbi:MAG TPA: SRPBCC family protein [Longimicrobium sp.]
MVPEQIEREVVIAAPVERVWDVITQPEHVGSWFGDAGAEIDLRPGGTILIHWKDYGTGYGIVERVEPPRVFAWRGALIGHTEVRPDNSTVVEFTLTPEGGGTRLRVVESGFHTLAVPADEATKQAEGNVEGWRIKMEELAAYVAGRVAA